MTDPILFELSEFTRVTVTSVNVRSEMHGDAHVPAVDVGFRLTAANTILDRLVPALRTMIYGPVTEDDEPPQAELDGVDSITDTPLLRCEDLEPLKLKKKLEGWTVEWDYGRGGKSNIVLNACTVDKFVADCKQGGSVDLTFRIQAANVKSDAIGKLGVMIGLEQSIRLTAPTVGEAIDGTEGHPGALAEQQSATDAFIEAHAA